MTPVSSTALSPAIPSTWPRVTLELAKAGGISPTSIYPYGRSVDFLIGHLVRDAGATASVDRLYERMRLLAMNDDVVDRAQFESHLERWGHLAGYSIDPAGRLHDARLRETPLGREARAAFVEGLLLSY